MTDLSAEIRQAYEAAQAADKLARQHPEHLEQALRAAEHFERTAVLSKRLSEAEDEDEEVGLVALVFAEYHLAMKHKCRGWHAYERRDCDTALDELQQEKRYLESAEREAERLMPSLSEANKTRLEGHLQSWKATLAAIPSSEYAQRARRAWDMGNAVEALDWYRHGVTHAEEMLELEKKVPPSVNPAARRVMRGNMYTAISNAAQAMGRVLFEQSKNDNRSLFDLSRDEGMQYLGHLLDWHSAGTTATKENPEWQQMGMGLQVCRSNIEQFLHKTKEYWPLVYSRYQGNKTLEMLMRQIDSERYAMAKEDKILRENKVARLWAIGSFWLFVLACITVLVAFVVNVVPLWAVLPSLIGIEVILLFIGAFTLRASGDLSQANFLKLIALAAKFQFRSLLGFSKAKPPEGPDSKSTA